MSVDAILFIEVDPMPFIPDSAGSGPMLPITITRTVGGAVVVADLDIPPDVDVTVYMWGSGGSGAGGPPGAPPGGGGGGSTGALLVTFPAAVWATVDSITLANGVAAGAANTDGLNGEDTIIAAGATNLAIAGKGLKGLVAGGVGGLGGTNTVHASVTTIRDWPGAVGSNGVGAVGGTGGTSLAPGSGAGGAGGTAAPGPGGQGMNPGGGGGGGGAGGAQPGGLSRQGKLVFTFALPG